MQTTRVVPALDVLEHRAVKARSRRPWAGVDELAFYGCEK